jgi:serine kinase of HPr protein (carbohydrate metabolism regulator)
MTVHAGLIATRVDGVWRGALIEGASGAGKSDLALRALGEGFRLVADDRVVLFRSEGRLFGRAPGTIAGLIEARGLGVLRETPLPFAEVAVLVVCAGGPTAIQRAPEEASREVLGAPLPVLDLWPFEPAAPAKLRRALQGLGRMGQQAYQARLAPPQRRLGG